MSLLIVFPVREGVGAVGEWGSTRQICFNTLMEYDKLHIEYVPIGQLKPASYNPRRISEREFEKLKNSLDKFGWAEPIVVNSRTDTVVGGHMRLQAAKALGMMEVPVVYIDLDPKEEKALNIALNKIAGEFDEDMLAELIASLDDDLTALTGFDEDELAKLQADPFSEETNELIEPTEPKVERWTTEQLRTLAKSYHPTVASSLYEFLDWLDRRGSGK